MPRLRLPHCLAAATLLARAAVAQSNDPVWLKDRGPGIPTSLFGTFVGRGELLIFPFGALTLDHDREYQPVLFGYGLNEDFRGKFRSTQAQLFVAYGVTNWLTVELEGARLDARLDKDPHDASTMPTRIQQSGIGDLEGQVRLRFLQEGRRKPELFGFLEMTPRRLSHKPLIGEPNWDLKPGVGVIRGFGFGTLSLSITAEWNREAKSPDLGEIEITYLKRVTPAFRINVSLAGGESGTNDEWTAVGGFRWTLGRYLALKMDSAFGIMSKATDLETQLGLMLMLPGARSR